MSEGYRQEIRRALIRQTLVEMTLARRHASALAWIADLSIEEEEYAKSIFREVEYEAAGGTVSGGHVSVSKVWDVPEPVMALGSGYTNAPVISFYPFVAGSADSFGDQLHCLIKKMGVNVSFQVPAHLLIIDKGQP